MKEEEGWSDEEEERFLVFLDLGLVGVQGPLLFGLQNGFSQKLPSTSFSQKLGREFPAHETQIVPGFLLINCFLSFSRRESFLKWRGGWIGLTRPQGHASHVQRKNSPKQIQPVTACRTIQKNKTVHYKSPHNRSDMYNNSLNENNFGHEVQKVTFSRNFLISKVTVQAKYNFFFEGNKLTTTAFHFANDPSVSAELCVLHQISWKGNKKGSASRRSADYGSKNRLLFLPLD